MAKYDRSISSQPARELIDDEQRSSVQAWLRLLQQALAVEADHGFTNLLGRGETFQSFMVRELGCFPVSKIYETVNSDLIKISDNFNDYPNHSESNRRRLVVKTRQYLYQLSQQFAIPDTKSSFHLKLNPRKQQVDKSTLLNSQKLSFSSLVIDLKGVGEKISDKLSRIGIITIKDLLLHYPRDYIDYSSLLRISELKAGETATLIATVRKCNSFKSPRNPNLSILELNLVDITGRIKVSRFFAGKRFSNYAYLKAQVKLYPPGSTVAVSGIVRDGPYGKTFQEPLIEVMESKYSQIQSKSIGRLVSVYSLTEGLTAERFRDLIDSVLPLVSEWKDPLQPSRLKLLSLPSKSEAILSIHRPFDKNSLQAARRRLVFDEFLLLQLGLLLRREELKKREAPRLLGSFDQGELVGKFLDKLPFSLTNAQKRVLSDITSDLKKSAPMSRLLQGDVGSGKTVVAIAALLNAVQSGWQGAFMAPTEVLAAQHYKTLCDQLIPLNVNVELLTGSTSRPRRRAILADLANGSVKILVGTHALIEDPVSFLRLGLVVVDEQHRFGVQQRNRLLSKGLQPHLLTMTATPIPRTLALSIHGDLDVSQIDELPPNRTPVQTNLLSYSSRDQAYKLIRKEVLKGQSAYFILPLVEESEKIDLRSAIDVHRQLSEDVFSDLSVGLLHGRMNSSDKKSIINEFMLGKCQILVSTTVVEVGVDVPKATVMVIDHADRFGLAQLHQLRGRVGRGGKTSYCLLINDSKSSLAKQRLEVLVSSNDGFEIAEIDLRLRGPGQVLGTKQSGLPDFALASLLDDASVLEQAREEATWIIENDPLFENNAQLRIVLDQHWEQFINKGNLN